MNSSTGVPYRVAEFYAGIGGFHYAFLQSGTSSSTPEEDGVVASIDVNTNTTAIYLHNFPSTNQMRRNICGMTASELDSFRANVFFLSPPCQPFTRQGSQRDNQDRRTDSFFHLMHILQEMRCPPDYVLMENVKGFECSNTRDEFVRVLQSLGYKFQEFLLSPSQFGIPNSRLRYYLLAKKKPLTFAHEEHSGVGQQSPITDPEIIIKALQSNMQSLGSPSCNKDIEDSIKACKQLSHYLQDLDDEVISECLVPDKILCKYAMALDIVRTTSANSCCFTKGYGNYAVGTGSVLQSSLTEEDFKKCFAEFKESDNDVKKLRSLKLRYFTPREVANLMCFPADFSFPRHLTIRQCYMALGNSLNVTVVSYLMQYLFL